MSDCEVNLQNVYKILNNTSLYHEWMKGGTCSEDIIEIAMEDHQLFDEDDEVLLHQSSAIIELHFELDIKLKLVLLRKGNIYDEETKYFLIEFKTVDTEYGIDQLKGIDLQITIKAEKLTLAKTKLETSFVINNSSSLSQGSSDKLENCIADSLSNLSLFGYEKQLQNNLNYFSELQNNYIKRHEFEHIGILRDIQNSNGENLNDQGDKNKQNSSNKEENKIKNDPENNGKEKCCIDGVWVKWTTDRLEDQENLEKFSDLKDRIHNKHSLPDVSESCMLRYLHGMEYNVDDAEQKIVHHIKYMTENDYWHIDESRIPNIIEENIMCVHKTDKYGRPLTYLRCARLNISSYDFDELMAYGFWNNENIRKSLQPHVESHVAIYDMKGVGKKNFNLAIFKKSIPILEDHMAELCGKIIVVRPGFIMNILWSAMKPFLHQQTLEKVQFIKENKLTEELTQLIPIENLPVVYGGEDTEFEEKFP